MSVQQTHQTTAAPESILIQARREVSALRPIAEKTEANYMAMVKRLLAGQASVAVKSTARLYKAAWIWYLRSCLKHLLQLAEPADSTWRRKVADHVGALYAIRASELATKRGTSSKRHGMGCLPPGWSSKMIEKTEGEASALLSLVAITGLRPAELQAGVHLQVVGKTLRATVSGAKVDEQRGQLSRTFSFPVSDPLVAIIAKALPIGCTEATVAMPSAALRHTLRRLARQALPDVQYRISPYTFRHYLASFLKKQQIDQVTLAKVLGHRSTKSQTYYGRPSYGDDRLIVECSVTTTSDVRDNLREIPFSPRSREDESATKS